MGGGRFVPCGLFPAFRGGVSLWSFDARDALLLTLLALGGVTLSIVSIFADFPVLVGAQVALAVYAFGQTFTIGGGNFTGLQVGFWLAAVAAIAMLGGAALLAASIWSTGKWKATTGLAGVRTHVAAVVPSETRPANGNGHPPAGWYADPSGQASQRYWSGMAWTAELRS
jgi:hypothetical protein